MKKILSAVAALGLVAGVASTASALEFNVSGHYFLEGVYLSSGSGDGISPNSSTIAGEDEDSNDAFWRHEFKIKPVMKVNDKITVKSTIYLAGSGQNTAGGSDGTWGQDDNATADGGNIDVAHIYMEYTSPVGLVRMGRTSAGLWQGDFLSNDQHANRLMFFPNFLPENVGACFFLQKSAENDGENTSADADKDVYEAAVWYKTKDMIAALGYDYIRNATDEGTAGTYSWNYDTTSPAITVSPATTGSLSTTHVLKGYYNQNFSNMYVESEVAYIFGEVEEDVETVNNQDQDIKKLGFMADVGMNMDKLDVGMMFIYATGQDDDELDDTELGSLGEQFQPYNILTGATTGMMVSDYNAARITDAGIISLGVHADFAVSDKLSLNSALVYAEAEADASGVDDELGWEIDLGMSYALLDNLTYQMDFGYLMAGDWFEETAADNMDAEDVYTLTHRLTMEF
jgi:hypothetical protein